MTAGLVSVVIPVRDGERYLAAAARSVLEQSYGPLELIVVDDGSGDRTPDILRSLEPSVRSTRQEPAGVNAAMNRGVALARADFLAFLDADDLWVSRKLELQMRAFVADPTLDAVFGHIEHFHSEELDDDQRGAIACPAEPMAGMAAGAMVVRRETFQRVGEFSTELQLGGFIDWYARATELGLASVMLPDVVLRRRLHGRNTTLKSRHAQVDYARIARAVLRRRRSL